MIEVVAGKGTPVATVVPIRGVGHVMGHLARYSILPNIHINLHSNISLVIHIILFGILSYYFILHVAQLFNDSFYFFISTFYSSFFILNHLFYFRFSLQVSQSVCPAKGFIYIFSHTHGTFRIENYKQHTERVWTINDAM